MLDVEVLVSELGAIDRLTTGSIASSEISTLGHEARDDAVELAALEVKILATVTFSSGSSSERGEVLHSFWDNTTEHAKDNTSNSHVVDRDVKEDLLGDFSEGICESRDRHEGGKDSQNFHGFLLYNTLIF